MPRSEAVYAGPGPRPGTAPGPGRTNWGGPIGPSVGPPAPRPVLRGLARAHGSGPSGRVPARGLRVARAGEPGPGLPEVARASPSGAWGACRPHPGDTPTTRTL